MSRTKVTDYNPQTNKYPPPLEEAEQMRLCVYLEKRGILYFAIPNQGKRSMTYAIKLKRLGVKPGVPDLFIASPQLPYNGLFIEMKRAKVGKVSESQQYWLINLRKAGYAVAVCYGFDQARLVVDQYMSQCYSHK